MNSRRAWFAVCVVAACTDFAAGQFQRSIAQPRRGRLSAAPAEVTITVSCLDYGVKTPGQRDVFASITEGHAFLMGSGGRRVDMNEGMRGGWVVLRGTGRDGEIVAEVRIPGWEEFEIKAGAQALPPKAREVDIPEATIALLERTGEVERSFEALPKPARELFERVVAHARQEHVWAVQSRSRQALDPGLRLLPAVLGRVAELRRDPNGLTRILWVLGRDLQDAEQKLLQEFLAAAGTPRPGLDFLGDALVLRAVQPDPDSRLALAAHTREGGELFGLNRADVRRLKPLLEGHQPGDLIVTDELMKALDELGLAQSLDGILAAAGHSFVWHMRDDSLLLHRFEDVGGISGRFAVIAPQTPAEAKALFGQSSLSAFAFKKLIAEQKLESVRTTADLADSGRGESVTLVCRQQFGQTPLADGSRLTMAALPPGLCGIIACDAIDLRENLPVTRECRGSFTFEGLAAATDSVLAAASEGGLTSAQTLQALLAGYTAQWKRQGVASPQVMKIALSVTGDAHVLGGNGTLLKLLQVRKPE